jgi:hypothetical protein
MEINFMIRIVHSEYVEEIIDVLDQNDDIQKISIRKTNEYLDVEGEF